MGVYHQRDVWSNADTFIILNPSKTFLQRLKDAQIVSGRLPTWRDIHILAASCATTPWRRYISYMESKLAQLVRKFVLGVQKDIVISMDTVLVVSFVIKSDIKRHC